MGVCYAADYFRSRYYLIPAIVVIAATHLGGVCFAANSAVEANIYSDFDFRSRDRSAENIYKDFQFDHITAVEIDNFARDVAVAGADSAVGAAAAGYYTPGMLLAAFASEAVVAAELNI